MREVFLMNAKMRKYIDVQKRNGSLDSVQLTPNDITRSNEEADAIFEQMDRDKVIKLRFMITKQSKAISKEEFVKALEIDVELKKRVESLLMVIEFSIVLM
jgi:hypothetical protein